MALVVEDGLGLSNAQSYVSVDAADDYHALRLNDAWGAATTAKREAALVRATAALDSGRAWRGAKSSSSQALEWPRIEAFDDDGFALEGVPVKLVQATCEAALVELAAPGSLTPSLERGGMIRREKVGPLEVEYAAGASAKTTYSAIDGLLRGLVVRGKRMARG